MGNRLGRILAGEATGTADIPYDFGGHHLGLVAAGAGGHEALRQIAAPLDRQLLLAGAGEGIVWAWLGGRRPLNADRLPDGSPELGALLAFGEPSRGLEGWRLTHRQALAALPFATAGSPTHYADVAIVATVAKDDLLTDSLRAIFLAPLQGARDGGAAARETLRAYFATGGNASSAAAVLGVSRRTVANRLREIEDRLGRSVSAFAVEIDAALRLEALGEPRRSNNR